MLHGDASSGFNPHSNPEIFFYEKSWDLYTSATVNALHTSLVEVHFCLCNFIMFDTIPYSYKYWWELNLVVDPKIAIGTVLANLNLVVRKGIAIHIQWNPLKSDSPY